MNKLSEIDKSGVNHNGITWRQWYQAALLATGMISCDIEDETWIRWLSNWRAGMDPSKEEKRMIV